MEKDRVHRDLALNVLLDQSSHFVFSKGFAALEGGDFIPLSTNQNTSVCAASYLNVSSGSLRSGLPH